VAQKPETQFRQRAVLPFLKKWLRRTHVFPIQQLAISGTPDLLLSCSGRFVGLELKSESGSPSKLQLWNLSEVRRTGGIGIVASPSNWRQVTYLLAKIEDGELEE
jgi:hypothetical protein